MSSSGPRKLTLENLQTSVWICFSLMAKFTEISLSGHHCSLTSPTADNSQKLLLRFISLRLNYWNLEKVKILDPQALTGVYAPGGLWLRNSQTKEISGPRPYMLIDLFNCILSSCKFWPLLSSMAMNAILEQCAVWRMDFSLLWTFHPLISVDGS